MSRKHRRPDPNPPGALGGPPGRAEDGGPLGERSLELPLVTEDDLPPSVGSESAPLRTARAGKNIRVRNPNWLLKLLALLVLANAALFITCLVVFYRKTQAALERRLAESSPAAAAAAATHAPAPAAASPPAPATPEPPPREPTPDFSPQIAELQKQVAGFQGKVTALEEALEATRKKLAAPQDNPASNLPPGDLDLILLKERNRLTAYADEAIATGARGPYERLWDTFDDERLANLFHAARAEILRVQDCFLNGMRVKFHGLQNYQIPVAEIFPDSAALNAAQLSDDQMIQLLEDQKQPWQTRVKAAWYLGQRRTTKVGDALVRSIKNDPILDVVAEATFSFEQVTGYHAKLFEVKPLEAWWKSYNEKTPPQKIAPKTKPAVQPPKKG